MNEDRISAEKIAPNITILTKDGRHYGNAIILKLIAEVPEPIWLIQTEFGSQIKITEPEIIRNFHLGFIVDSKQHLGTQISNLMKRSGCRALANGKNRIMAEEEFRKVNLERADEERTRERLRKAKQRSIEPPRQNRKKISKALPMTDDAALVDLIFQKRQIQRQSNAEKTV